MELGQPEGGPRLLSGPGRENILPTKTINYCIEQAHKIFSLQKL